MDSTTIITMAVVFIVIAVVTSAIYYFARYYVKTDKEDQELLTKKPVDWEQDLTINRVEVDVQPKSPSRTTPKKLDEALAKSREGLWGRIKRLAGPGEIASNLREELEEILYTSDLGPVTAEILLAKAAEKLTGAERQDIESVRTALRAEMMTMFAGVPPRPAPFDKVKGQAKPAVWIVVGVNGAGKTTTIGKLASLAKTNDLKTLIVAGDTFRAAADSQLKAWAERSGSEIFSPGQVKDPSAVAFSGLERAVATQADLVIVDTAGRLHTQDHLMEELKKMKRVLAKVKADAPHECLLVIDANAGQNALQQAREFHSAVGLTGVVITKLDGSSKAGVALGVANELKLPIVYIGVGESVEDLRIFEARSFVEAIL